MVTTPNSIVLETPRLLLKELSTDTYAWLFSNCNDQELMSYLGVDAAGLEIERTKYAGGFTTYRMSMKLFMMMDKQSGSVIGRCGFHNWYAEHSRSEIGYMMTTDDAKNKGYMTEALKVMIPYGFEQMNLARIEAFIGSYNVPSLKIAKKFGFTQEGVLRLHYRKNDVLEDSVCFSLLKHEYDLLKQTPAFSL